MTRRDVLPALAAFAVLTCLLATQHVMWRDEVGALTAAIEPRTWGDLFHQLHVEAHPIVWYAVLRIGYAITHSNLVLPIATLLFAIIAAYVILRYAPFPLVLRLLIVFGVFLAHEYALVARNYTVGVMLMMIACVVFPTRNERAWLLALVLALMANTSLHAAVVVGVLIFLWATDLFSPATRPAFLRAMPVLSIAVVTAAIVFAILSSRPSPEMAYGVDGRYFNAQGILASILKDPGLSLHGIWYGDIAGAGELPWQRAGIDPTIPSRIIVDVAILGVLWSLRRSRACLVALVLALLAFEVLFSTIYGGSLRHQGLLTFLMIALCWIATERAPATNDVGYRKSIWIGLLPLLVTQTLALPFAIRRDFVHPASSSKSLAQLIESNPKYRTAILLSEPDYFMQTMPYYVKNPVYMPRQHELATRTYFDRGARRQQQLSLSQLLNLTDSLSCSSNTVALLSIGYPHIMADGAGIGRLSYGSARFTWNADERRRLFESARHLASFRKAATDENYDVFEVDPERAGVCQHP